jgi:hypothetical protein
VVYTITAREQRFYASKSLSIPKRCIGCRKITTSELEDKLKKKNRSINKVNEICKEMGLDDVYEEKINFNNRKEDEVSVQSDENYYQVLSEEEHSEEEAKSENFSYHEENFNEDEKQDIASSSSILSSLMSVISSDEEPLNSIKDLPSLELSKSPIFPPKVEPSPGGVVSNQMPPENKSRKGSAALPAKSREGGPKNPSVKSGKSVSSGSVKEDGKDVKPVVKTVLPALTGDKKI